MAPSSPAQWFGAIGSYRLHLALAAGNARVQRRVLDITFSGRWNDDEAKMFTEEIQIQLLTTRA
jgi:hypothetical protein